ncbi:MAG: nucleoside deaminase [Tenericutes bacterium]|nr:nucleoside deaminase [Mycoplasmatota bacterium]
MNKNIIIEKLKNLNEKAKKSGDVPISCIVVKDNKIVSEAYNMKEKLNDPTAHAEILAIKKAAKVLKTWNLKGCIIYVTLKPCDMCFEVIKEARIKSVNYILPIEKKVNNNIVFKQIVTSEKDSFSKELKEFFNNKR